MKRTQELLSDTGVRAGQRLCGHSASIAGLHVHQVCRAPGAKDPSLQVTWQHPWEGAMVRNLRLGNVKLASRSPQPTWG